MYPPGYTPQPTTSPLTPPPDLTPPTGNDPDPDTQHATINTKEGGTT